MPIIDDITAAASEIIGSSNRAAERRQRWGDHQKTRVFEALQQIVGAVNEKLGTPALSVSLRASADPRMQAIEVSFPRETTGVAVRTEDRVTVIVETGAQLCIVPSMDGSLCVQHFRAQFDGPGNGQRAEPVIAWHELAEFEHGDFVEELLLTWLKDVGPSTGGSSRSFY